MGKKGRASLAGAKSPVPQTEVHRSPSAKTIAAPFSAIIMVGAAVLPEVMVGITEASITRRRSRPITRSRSSTTAKRIGVAAHPGGADRVEDGGADIAGRLTSAASSSSAHALAGQIFDRVIFLQSAGCATTRRVTERIAVGGDAAVVVGRQIIRLDRRGGVRGIGACAAGHGRGLMGCRSHTLAVKAGKRMQRLAEFFQRQRLDVELEIGALAARLSERVNRPSCDGAMVSGPRRRSA